MEACCATAGGGHRRAQADCPLPQVCPSARCAEVFQAFYSGCSAELEASPELGAGLAALSASCNELLGDSSLAHQLNLQCTDASLTAEDCVPPCNAEYHGYMLLLNLDGDDSKFSCNLAHGLYSWVGAASEGGYLGADAQSFFSAVISGAAGRYIVTLTADAGINTDVVIQPAQEVRIGGDMDLATKPSWGSGGFTVQERGSLTLTYVAVDSGLVVLVAGRLALQACALSGVLSVTGSIASLSMCTVGGSFSPIVTGGGSLSLASMVLHGAVLAALVSENHGVGSTLQLSAVTVQEIPDLGALTGTMTEAANGKMTDPVGFGVAPYFTVSSGPCEIFDSGRCVGRPGGYGPSEACEIVVGVGGGALGPCGVFDMQTNHCSGDFVTLPAGYDCGSVQFAHHSTNPDCSEPFCGSDCPVGAVLPAGGSVGWISNGGCQGSCPGSIGNTHCHALGTCGLRYSNDGLGGGWQICFAT